MRNRFTLILASISFLGACAEEPTSHDDAARHAPDPVLQSNPQGSDSYIVLFSQDEANVPSLARQLIRNFGGIEIYVWEAAVKGFAVKGLPVGRIEALKRHPRVRLVESDARMQLSGQQILPYIAPSYAISPLWALDRIDHSGTASFNGLYNYTNVGAGTHVYIVDSGVRGGHVEFSGRVGNGACFIILSLGCSPTIDALGHGTAAASVAAGTTYGVAKLATIHSVRVTDDGGGAIGVQCSDVISGLNWIKANALYPAVASVGINGYPSCFAVRDAIDQLVASNVLVFKSAGNANVDAFDDRSNRSLGSVVVGGANANDFRVANSNFGNTVTLMAPGIAMRAAWSAHNTDFAAVSGTSFAAPLAAGVGAAILSANNALTAGQLKTVLLTGASQVTVGNGSGVANRVLHSQITPPNTITAAINGPSVVRSGETCLYVASAGGAPGPYSFSWTVNGASVGSNSATLYHSNQGSFHDIAVTISSPNALPGATNLGVSVSGGAPSCVE